MSVCPKCENDLTPVTYEGKELLQCNQCQGFWFKAGQFREVKQHGFAGLYTEEEVHIHTDDVISAEDSPEIVCPNCAELLSAYNYAYSSDIQLHRCTACKGIWANAHSLLKIDRLLVSYQESLEEAKAKAMPLMMEAKRQFVQKQQAWEEERQRQKKQGLFGRLFGKKKNRSRNIEDIVEDIHDDKNNPT